MAIGDYLRNRGATEFSFLIREKNGRCQGNSEQKIFPLPLRMKHEMPVLASALDSPECRAESSYPGTPGSALSWLHCWNWAAKGRGGGGKEGGRRILHLSEGKASSFLQQSTGNSYSPVLPALVCEQSSGVKDTPVIQLLTLHLLLSDLVYCRSLKPEGLLFDIGI